MNRTQLAAAILLGCGLAIAAPAVASAAPNPPAASAASGPQQRSEDRAQLTGDAVVVLGTYGGVSLLGALGLFVATRPGGLD